MTSFGCRTNWKFFLNDEITFIYLQDNHTFRIIVSQIHDIQIEARLQILNKYKYLYNAIRIVEENKWKWHRSTIAIFTLADSKRESFLETDHCRRVGGT